MNTVPESKLIVLELQGIKGYKDKIIRRIEGLGICQRVEFHGRLTKNEFNHYLEKAQVIVVPEQWENMSPVIVVEGMANGKLIIASKIGGIPEFIHDGIDGFLVERENPNNFAEKIIWCFNNQEVVKNMGQKAKEKILRICNKQKILTDLLKLYQNL